MLKNVVILLHPNALRSATFTLIGCKKKKKNRTLHDTDAKFWNTQPMRHATQKQARRNTHNQRKSGLSFTVDVRLDSQVSGLSLVCVYRPHPLPPSLRSTLPGSPNVPVFHLLAISKLSFRFLVFEIPIFPFASLILVLCILICLLSLYSFL